MLSSGMMHYAYRIYLGTPKVKILKSLFSRWDYLEIFTSIKEDDVMQAYAAGLLEGYVTADLINTHWYNVFQNFCDGRAYLCEKLNEFLWTNKNWVMSQVTEKNGSDAYWHQVCTL